MNETVDSLIDEYAINVSSNADSYFSFVDVILVFRIRPSSCSDKDLFSSLQHGRI